MFPKEVPLMAFRQVARYVTGTDKDHGRFALAGWSIIGYGLGQWFPNAAFLADQPPIEPQAAIAKLAVASDAELATLSPEFEQLIQIVGPLLFKLLMRRLGITI